MASWVSLAAHTTPPDVPLLACLSHAHMTYIVPLQVCAAHATPSSVHMQGCTTFPSTPVIFPHSHSSMVPLGLTCSAHECTSYLACSHWSSSCAHTTSHGGTMGLACSTHMQGCTTQPSLPPLVHPPCALNIAWHPCGSGSVSTPASHVCGHYPCPELIVVLHYIYCTLNKQLSVLPLTVLHACVTIGPDPIYALNN